MLVSSDAFLASISILKRLNNLTSFTLRNVRNFYIFFSVFKNYLGNDAKIDAFGFS